MLSGWKLKARGGALRVLSGWKPNLRGKRDQAQADLRG